MFRFQNRRTKWKKIENISNTEAAEHKLGIRNMSTSSTSSSSSPSLCDHNKKQFIQVSIDEDNSNSEVTIPNLSDSNRSNKQLSHVSPMPLIYFNNFTHLLRPSSSTTLNNRSCSVSPQSRNDEMHSRCSSLRSTPITTNHIDEFKGNENIETIQHSKST